MSRRPANVTQADIARALRALQALGLYGRVEVHPGGVIHVVPSDRPEPAPDARAPVDRDRVIAL
jgi:hypothetical protein